MNKVLYAYEMRRCRTIVLVFLAILTMYIAAFIWMFNPEMMKTLEQLYLFMPKVMAAVGMKPSGATLLGYLITYLYGFILLVFPMLFTILRSKDLLAGKVEKKTMASLLASPVSRRTIVRTQILVLLTCWVLLVGYTTAVEILFCQLWYPGQLDIPALLAINASLLALYFFIGGICMLSSASVSDAGLAVGISGGFLAFSFVFQMLSHMELPYVAGWVKYASFFTLFDPEGMLERNTFAWTGILILCLGGILLYILAEGVFVRRDLPL